MNAIGTERIAATSMLRNAPEPAWEITPGTITKTDEAGVTEESVNSSAPNTRMVRFSARDFAGPDGFAAVELRLSKFRHAHVDLAPLQCFAALSGVKASRTQASTSASTSQACVR